MHFQEDFHIIPTYLHISSQFTQLTWNNFVLTITAYRTHNFTVIPPLKSHSVEKCTRVQESYGLKSLIVETKGNESIKEKK